MRCRNRKLLSGIMIALGLAAGTACIVSIINECFALKRGELYYTEISGDDSEKKAVSSLTLPTGIEDAGDSPAPPAEPPAEPAREEFAPISDEPEPVSEERTASMDFAALRENAPDITAWLRLEDSVIDYPVVQAGDNDYYLHHLPDGTKNVMGSLFLDYRNTADFTDKNSVIYGHHMKNGEMFASLKHYKNQDYYDTHTSLELFTEYGDYTIMLFAGYVVDAQTETVPKKFAGDGAFLQYIEQIRARSTFESPIEVGADDRLVSLCTCIYDFNDARYILTGKLIQWSGGD